MNKSDHYYDCIILGTSLEQCIISQKLSSLGKKVLQIDRNRTYGSDLRTLRYSQLLDKHNSYQSNRNTEKRAGLDELLLHDKKFNIDLTPKFLLANGLMTDFLADQSIEHLLEFVGVQGSFVYKKSVLHMVPCSEAMSLKSGLIGLLQKPRVAHFFWNVRKFCEMKEDLIRNEMKNMDDSIMINKECLNRKSSTDMNEAEESEISQAKTGSSSNDKTIAERVVDSLIESDTKDDSKSKVEDVKINKSDITSSRNNNISQEDAKNKEPLENVLERASLKTEQNGVKIINNVKIKETLKRKFKFPYKTMKEEFKHYKLNDNSVEIIGHSIALNLNNDYLENHPIETYDKLYFYIKSLVAVNQKSSPFIYPLFGLSEMCQAFSRRAGAFGCVFMLDTPIIQIKYNNGDIIEDFEDKDNMDEIKHNTKIIKHDENKDNAHEIKHNTENLKDFEKKDNAHEIKLNTEIIKDDENKDNADEIKHNTENIKDDENKDNADEIKLNKENLKDFENKNNAHEIKLGKENLKDFENKNNAHEIKLSKENLKDFDKKDNTDEIKLNTEIIKDDESFSKKSSYKYKITVNDNFNKKTREIYTQKIITEPIYFPSLIKTISEIITCVCIIKGTPKIIKNNDVSSAHIIFLADEMKRKNDIFLAILGERENCCPHGYSVAIISSIKEELFRNELDCIVDLLGNVIDKFVWVRDISVRDTNKLKDRDIIFCKNVDQTTHFESLYENILESLDEIGI